MVKWELAFSKQALKDAKKLKAAGLRTKADELLAILLVDPFQTPPTFEKLVGDLAGAYSRRSNIHNRLLYEVFVKERVVRILRMWTHFDVQTCGPNLPPKYNALPCGMTVPLTFRNAGANVCGLLAGKRYGLSP